MSVIVIRARPRDRGNAACFTERMLDWPDDAVSAYKDLRTGEWRFLYRSELLQQKRERMARALWRKRGEGVARRRALHVWTFWCPGVAGFAFRGWWCYLKGIGGGTIHGGGFKENLAGDLLRRIRELFPAGMLPWADDQDWMANFSRQYQRGLWCGQPQGKQAVWAMVRDERVIEISAVDAGTQNEEPGRRTPCDRRASDERAD